MPSRIKVNKGSQNFFVFLGICFFLIIVDNLGLLSPVRRFGEMGLSPIKSPVYTLAAKSGQIWTLVTHYGEEREWQTRSIMLERENLSFWSEAKKLKSENESLRKQLEAPLPPDWKFHPSRVLGISRYMQIYAGSREGIKEGMSVASGKFYIGKIIVTHPRTSTVLLPNDPESLVPAISSRGTKGNVVGSFGEKVFFEKVLQKDPLFIDDIVETTGEEGFAPGLIIGKVGLVEAKDFEVYKKGELVPYISYNQETTVFVVKEY